MRAAIILTLAALTLPSLASAQDANAAKDPANFAWVEQGVLAVGGGGLNESQVDLLYDLGFRAIVDLRAEHDDPAEHILGKGMTFLDLPIDSASDLNATQFAFVVEWVREQEDAGRPVYMHCTNGWHRAAAFAVAWHMADDDDTYDEAAHEVRDKRPGTVMRAVAGLLDYQATLTGEQQAAVTLVSSLSHPGEGGTMDVHVDVVAGGAPAAGAHVQVWAEGSRVRLDGTADANGRFSFPYTAPAGKFMEHLYARASVDGYADGADNVEFIFAHAAKERGALDVVAEARDEGIFVKATSNGKPVATRLVLSAPGWTAFEASARGEALFTDAPAGATIDVRVVSWGSDGGTTRVDTPAPPVVAPPVIEPPPQEVPPQQEPPVQETPPVAPPANGPSPSPNGAPFTRYEIARVLAERYGVAILAVIAVIAVAYVAARRRSGVGNA